MATLDEPVCRFYRLIEGAPDPRRADRSADGTLPMRAYRYCEAVAAASAFGFYIYPPLDFSLIWDGTEIRWTYSGADGWYALRGAPAPMFQERFEKAAPEAARSLIPAFLTPLREPGVVQIWSGYLARTAPGWALLSRGVVNVPRTQPYEHYENYEGIVETETWFGPLFTNIRLTQTNSPLEFCVRYPLFQVQPVLRECYRDPPFEVLGIGDLGTADWDRYAATMRPNTDTQRTLGHYAVDTRKRQRGGSSPKRIAETGNLGAR
jgi:hypothetical protein